MSLTFFKTRRRPLKGLIGNATTFCSEFCAERFRNFAEQFRNRSAKFRNCSAKSLSATQRKMSTPSLRRCGAWSNDGGTPQCTISIIVRDHFIVLLLFFKTFFIIVFLDIFFVFSFLRFLSAFHIAFISCLCCFLSMRLLTRGPFFSLVFINLNQK